MADIKNVIEPFSNEQERKFDLQDVNKVNIPKRMSFNKKVESFLAKCVKENKAFCSHCAIRAYEEFKDALGRKHVANVRAGLAPPNLSDDFDVNLEKFCKGMKKVGETSKAITRNVHGATSTVGFAVFDNYRCSECEGGLSIERDTKVL